MGVTIHFEGNLKSSANFYKVIDIAKQFAEKNNFKYEIFKEENKLLERVKDEQNWDYQGLTSGIVINVDTNCDPLNFEFDKELYIQEYCKTQFADISVHVLVISLLKKVEPYFEILKIDDEGEYWDTADITILQTHFDNCFKAIEETKKEDNLLQGPFRLDNGRIIDLMF